ncbi:winged helix-turn-helix domain-containing protein [Streptomyces sp. NPDC002044]|uniref:GntR family transcriptional regulator n=1 Tax=Streptomyces sp. NPDC002044 TaxID=3154662 RepID=UPI00331E5A1F
MELSPDDPRPPYLQVAAALRDGIAEGKYQPGSRLPSGRQLAKEFGIALMTAQNALRVLREEGAVTSHQGRGVFVRDPSAPPTTADEKGPPSLGLAQELEAIRGELQHVNDRLARLEAQAGSSSSSSTKDPIDRCESASKRS